jgi:ATP-binding cassette, subfamily C, bacterial
MRRLVALLLRRPRALWWLAFWSLPETVPTLVSGYAIARAVDGFRVGRSIVGLEWLGLLGVAVLVGAYGTGRVYRSLAAAVEPVRDDLVRHVASDALRRAAASGNPADTGAVARLTAQVETVRDTLAGLLVTVRGFAFALAGAGLGLVSLAPVVAAIVLPPVLAGLVAFLAMLPAMARRQRRYVRGGERLAEAVGRAAAGLRDVAACGAEEQTARTIGRYVDGQARAEQALARMAAVRALALAIGGWLPVVLLLAGTPWLLRRGLSAGTVLGALAYVLHGLVPALHTLVRGIGGGGLRLAVTLERVLGDETVVATGIADATPGDCGLRLAGVTFRYGPHAEPVLDRLDLEVPPGDHLAIVGPSGIGKSTLAALMAGMLVPQAGQVLLGGVPVDRLDGATLARHRVLIPQEAYVFTGPLWDNLTYLCPGAGTGAVDAAVDAVGLGPVVARLGGYRAPVDPAALSAGERQLVALARAYLSPARLAILDEATCHLDPATEARAENAFARRGYGLVVIAHRISSAIRARRVLVLDGARARLGTHAELAEASPLYRDLVGRWTTASPPPAPPVPLRAGSARSSCA